MQSIKALATSTGTPIVPVDFAGATPRYFVRAGSERADDSNAFLPSYEASAGAATATATAILQSMKKFATRHVLTQQCHVLSFGRNR
jgi:hypothetical protein